MFNLTYDGGIFIGLYDNGAASYGVEPYPPGSPIHLNGVPGTVVSVPVDCSSRNIPGSDSDLSPYIVRVSDPSVGDNGIVEVSASEMPKLVPPSPTDAPTSGLLPTWVNNEQKIMCYKDGKHHKCFLEHDISNGWRVSHRRRNGQERWGVPLPNLIEQFSTYVNSNLLIPGWQRPSTWLLGHSSHISAANLTQHAPASIKKAFHKDNTDRATWRESYDEEYDGLLDHDTYDVISGAEYNALRRDRGVTAIPSMCVFTIKTDEFSKPVRAKSRIVVLGNHETTPWTKSDCYAPVTPQHSVRLLAAQAVLHRTVLKQGDCKNAFCHPTIPDDEITVVRPPVGCPRSKPGTYWKLKKTLYGLRRSPSHWFHLVADKLKEVGMEPLPHDPCIFYGFPIPGRPPLYLGLYVDDFVYFSQDPTVEKQFELNFSARVKVDFMGDVDYFLGVYYQWTRHTDGNVSVHLSQPGYAQALVEDMDLLDFNPVKSPYRHGVPVDSLPEVDMPEHERESLRKVYRRFLGKLNWLSISTRPDLATIFGLLSSKANKPTPAHLDSIRHVGRYLKSTIHLGIQFSSIGNSTLDGFVHFPIDPNEPLAFADSNWGPQDASRPSPKNMRPVSIDETKSICGHIIFLAGGPLIWRSHKEKRNSGSSTEAEVKATDLCARSVLSLRHILNDLHLIDLGDPTIIYNDNQAAVDWSKSFSMKSFRHHNISENIVREACQLRDILVRHIAGVCNPSDLHSKEHKSDTLYGQIRDSFMAQAPNVFTTSSI